VQSAPTSGSRTPKGVPCSTSRSSGPAKRGMPGKTQPASVKTTSCCCASHGGAMLRVDCRAGCPACVRQRRGWWANRRHPFSILWLAQSSGRSCLAITLVRKPELFGARNPAFLAGFGESLPVYDRLMPQREKTQARGQISSPFCFCRSTGCRAIPKEALDMVKRGADLLTITPRGVGNGNRTS
jgi:hypothetical protein